jgi:TRAP-type C4-dicarboxylate transport system permease small subunit
VQANDLANPLRALKVSGQLICVACLAILFIGLFGNVILRYFFGSGLNWAYDIHSILFPWMIGAGAVLATIHGRQIAIPLLLEASSRPVAKAIYLLACLLTATISLAVAWSSLPILNAAHYQRIEALGGIRQFWGYLSITYAFLAIGLLSILDAVTIALRYRGVPVNFSSDGLS